MSNLGNEKAELENQRYLELAREYETKGAAEYKLFEEYQERAGTMRDYMTLDEIEDYKRNSGAASYHFEKYYEYSALAEKYRKMAANK